MSITGTAVNGSERSATDRAAGERGKAVDAAILSIEKQFGRGSIERIAASTARPRSATALSVVVPLRASMSLPVIVILSSLLAA